MKRSLALIAVVGLFLLGIVIGASGMHLYDVRHSGPGPWAPGPPADGMRGRAHLERLEQMLGLTAEQKRQLEEILLESHVKGETLHSEMLPRVREHMERTRVRIEAILTPEQRERFEEMAREHRGRLERFFLGRHGPPPPHSP